MRPWRKLYASIITSDKISCCSDSAALLFDLLVVAQDDAGLYPWTPAKIKALTVSRQWSERKTSTLLNELLKHSLIVLETHESSFVKVCGGSDKNGRPPNYGTAFFYSDSMQDRVEPESEPSRVRPLDKTRSDKSKTRSDKTRNHGTDNDELWGNGSNGLKAADDVLSPEAIDLLKRTFGEEGAQEQLKEIRARNGR